MATTKFVGFDPSLIEFLNQLAENNNRDWFSEHKHLYESDVREPVFDFITEMQPRLKKISKHFLAIPKKSGGSLMRVYRDTRFSKDKTPYKTNVGIQFRHAQGKDVHAPGFYLHLEATGVFIGVGLWHPEAEALKNIRQTITDKPAAWKKIRDEAEFKKNYELRGTSLKRPPRDFPADHAMMEDLKRKDFIAIQELSVDDIYKKNFTDRVEKSFVIAKPFMSYLCKAVGVPF